LRSQVSGLRRRENAEKENRRGTERNTTQEPEGRTTPNP
jgi:hypothetical protein